MDDLSASLDRFDPRQPLDGFSTAYVGRDDTAWERLDRLIGASEPTHILFSGARGSGKTTELNRLRVFEHMQVLNIAQYVPPGEARAVDVLACMAYWVVMNVVCGNFENDFGSKCADELQKPETNKQTCRISKMVRDYILTSDHFSPDANYDWKTDRKVLFDSKLRGSFDESVLLDYIDLVAGVIHKATGRRITILVDGFDRADPGYAEKVLLEQGSSLAAPQCNVVYTVPLAALYSSQANVLWETFDAEVIHPNFRLWDQGGEVSDPGVQSMSEVIAKRLTGGEGPKVEAEALREAILMSGGVTRELLRIMQYALSRTGEDGLIKRAHVDQAVADVRAGMQRSVGLDQYETLRKIHKHKQLVQVPGDRDLIHNLMVLEYRNHSRWVDVHPVLKALIGEE